MGSLKRGKNSTNGTTCQKQRHSKSRTIKKFQGSNKTGNFTTLQEAQRMWRTIEITQLTLNGLMKQRDEAIAFSFAISNSRDIKGL